MDRSDTTAQPQSGPRDDHEAQIISRAAQRPRDLRSMATQLDNEMDIFEQDEARVNANVIAQAEAAQVAERARLGLPPLTLSSSASHSPPPERTRLGLPPLTLFSSASHNPPPEHMRLGQPPLTLSSSASDDNRRFKTIIPEFKEHWKKNHATSVRNNWASQHQDTVSQLTFHSLYS